MPKPFVIGIEIEEIALGTVLRKLNGLPGVVAVHMDFDKPSKPAKTAKTNGHYKPRGNFKESGTDALLKIIGNKTVRASDLAAVFEAQGRSARSINSPLHLLKKRGLMRSTKEGYELTDKGKSAVKALGRA